MNCERFESLIEAYLGDALDEVNRTAFRDHLRSCSACRERAVRVDPTLMLIALPPRPEHPERVEAVTQAVLGQIRQRRIERRLHPPRRRWLAAAAMVVVSIAGVTGWRLLSGIDDQVPAETATAVQAAESAPPPRAEVDMVGEGVRVYQYADDMDGDSAVYFVVNPSLEL